MTCGRRGGPTEAQRVMHLFWRDQMPEFVENIPARVCVQCGERYFGPAATRALTRLRRDSTPPSRIVEVPVDTLPNVDERPEMAPTNTGAPVSSDDLLSSDEAAAIVGVNRHRIWQLIEARRLPAHRVGRAWLLPRSAVEEYAASERRPGPKPRQHA